MKPETIKKLRENVPEFRELLAFLAGEAMKLNTLDGLEGLPVAERTDALAGRLWAHKTISAMLMPLVGEIVTSGGINPKEYAVDVA